MSPFSDRLLVSAQGAPQKTTLSFAQAIAAAASSPAVKLAEGQLELARQQLAAAAGLVSSSLSTTYTQYAPAGADQTAAQAAASSAATVTLAASLNVVPYGDVADGATRAKWALENAAAALQDAKVQSVLDAATQYLVALRYSQEKTALSAALGVAETALKATQTRLNAGAASSADVLNVQITLSQAQNNVAAVAGEPPVVTLPNLGDKDALLTKRSDVLGAQLAVQAAQQSANAATRSVLPSGGVSARYKTSELTFGAGLSTQTYQPSVSLAYSPSSANPAANPTVAGTARTGLSAQLSLSIPLNSGSGATLAAANIGVQNAQQQLEQTQAQARLELQAAQNQLATARNSLQAARALVTQRRQALATTKTRLGLGLVAPYEVQSAEASLLDAQVQFARLQDNVLLAQLTLLRTLSLNPLEVL